MDREAIVATTHDGVTRAARDAYGAWLVEHHLDGRRVRALAAHPLDPGRVYAGGPGGVLASDDGGRTWRGSGLEDETVTALAVSAVTRGLAWAGTKPAGLHVTRDAGATWTRVEGFDQAPGRWWWWTPAEPGPAYVQALIASPADPDVVHAGIEVGGVVSTFDGGRTWERARGALLDCHALAAHPTDATRFYEGGAGRRAGAAVSADGGHTWRKIPGERGHNYGWAVTADPADADVVYWAASTGPGRAHGTRDARAHVYRSRHAGPAERITPEPLTGMPYALLPDSGEPGRLVAVLSDGRVLERVDDAWRALPVNVGRVERTAVRVGVAR